MMILEARTIDPRDARHLAAAGWARVKNQESGSEFVYRWPDESRWPGDPLGCLRTIADLDARAGRS